MDNNFATMKIDNNSVESKPLNKSQLNNNHNLIDKNVEQSLGISNTQPTNKVGNLNTKICNKYKNKRKECKVCDRLILATLLHHGLCEMCSVKGNNKLEYFKIKMNIKK